MGSYSIFYTNLTPKTVILRFYTKKKQTCCYISVQWTLFKTLTYSPQCVFFSGCLCREVGIYMKNHLCPPHIAKKCTYKSWPKIVMLTVICSDIRCLSGKHPFLYNEHQIRRMLMAVSGRLSVVPSSPK